MILVAAILEFGVFLLGEYFVLPFVRDENVVQIPLMVVLLGWTAFGFTEFGSIF